MPEPDNVRGRLASGALSALIHATLLALIFLAAWLTPDQVVEDIIEIQHIPDQVSKEKAAPRPKVLAESRSRFDPAPMALAPRVLNPAVIQPRANRVQAHRIDVATISPVLAPRAIARPTAPRVDQVRAYQSNVTATAQPVAVEAPAPALAGPTELEAPVGVLSGPRQVATRGSSVGTAGPGALGSGSSVREGIASSRDVLGARQGVRASVNWSVGAGGGRGSGGSGSGAGGVSWDQCVARSEVQHYLAMVKDRVVSRWILPVDVPGNEQVRLRFVLDPAGTANRVQFVGGAESLGESAVQAMRAASPFPQLPNRARCLAGSPLVATFRNPTVASN